MANKQEYYRFKENLAILSNLGKQVDTISDIINTYGIGDMPLKEVKEFLMNRCIKKDNDTFENFMNYTISKTADEWCKKVDKDIIDALNKNN